MCSSSWAAGRLPVHQLQLSSHHLDDQPEEDIIKTLDHRKYMVEVNRSFIMNEGSPSGFLSWLDLIHQLQLSSHHQVMFSTHSSPGWGSLKRNKWIDGRYWIESLRAKWFYINVLSLIFMKLDCSQNTGTLCRQSTIPPPPCLASPPPPHDHHTSLILFTWDLGKKTGQHSWQEI